GCLSGHCRRPRPGAQVKTNEPGTANQEPSCCASLRCLTPTLQLYHTRCSTCSHCGSTVADASPVLGLNARYGRPRPDTDLR
ncbi:hypothetical protein NPIL_218821, partial [Nephila pilipes]